MLPEEWEKYYAAKKYKWYFQPQVMGYWGSDDDNKKENKNAEVNEDMKLGEIVVEKNGLENIFDGELVMLAPGYELEDFVVSRQDKSLRIVTQKDNGIKKNNLKDFVLVKDYSVKRIGYNVTNGVFKLKVEYDLDANVKVDKSL